MKVWHEGQMTSCVDRMWSLASCACGCTCAKTHTKLKKMLYITRRNNLVPMLPLMPNSFHIDLFQLAPSQLMWSASRPAFSQRIATSTMTLFRVAKTSSTWVHSAKERLQKLLHFTKPMFDTQKKVYFTLKRLKQDHRALLLSEAYEARHCNTNV